MRAQQQRALVAGLGAIAAGLAIILILLLVSGGGDDETAAPGVSIVSLRATGHDAVIDFSVDGSDEPSAVSIDWGDGSTPLELSGSGQLSASHAYPAEEAGERVVVVTVTAPDGAVLQASRPLILGEPDDPEGSTTTTEDPDATTSTTSSTTTSTTSTTTTTTTPPTTTAPPRPTLEFELNPSDARFRQSGSGDGSARLNGRTIVLDAITSGLDGEAVRTATLIWRIPDTTVADLEGPYQVRALLEPDWSVLLQASKNSGRAARFFVEFTADADGRSLGSASDSRSVGTDEEERFGSVEVLGFGTTIDGEDLTDLSAQLVVTCQAIPGSTIFQVGETSECATGGDGFTIIHARIQLVPVD